MALHDDGGMWYTCTGSNCFKDSCIRIALIVANKYMYGKVHTSVLVMLLY